MRSFLSHAALAVALAALWACTPQGEDGVTFPAPACDPADFTQRIGAYAFEGELERVFEDHPDWQDHPTPGVVNDAVFVERNGRLEFEVPSASKAASEAWQTLRHRPPSDRSWKIEADLTLPLSWNSGTDPEDQIGVGLWVGKPGGSTVYEIDFLAVATGERAVLAQNIQDRHGGDPNYVPAEIAAEQTSLMMSILYCADDHTLSVYYDGDTRVDTQPVDGSGLFDWEMGPVFEVGLIGFAEGPSATADFPSADDWGVFENPHDEAAARIAFHSTRDGNPEIYTMDLSGGSIVRLTENPAEDSYASWSPDSTKLVFESDREGNFEIYTMNADGSSPTRLTQDPADDLSSSWSPDGSRIAFVSFRDGPTSEIYVMNADGSDQTRLTYNELDDEAPHFSPDGSRIATETGEGGRRQIYVMNADGSDHRPLTKGAAYHGYPTWSPDGTKIAFDSDMEGGSHLFMMDADGTNLRQVTRTGAVNLFANWSRSGNELLFMTMSGEDRADFFTINLETSDRQRITNTLYLNTAPSCRGH